MELVVDLSGGVSGKAESGAGREALGFHAPLGRVLYTDIQNRALTKREVEEAYPASPYSIQPNPQIFFGVA